MTWTTTQAIATLAAAAALVACGSQEPAGTAEEATHEVGQRASETASEIAFSRSAGTKQDRFPDIWVMGAEGSGQTRLTAETEAWDTQPAWSPDGERIAFARGEIKGTRETVRTLGSHPVDIWVMNADGTEQTNLSESRDSLNYSPAFAPDGERIAFVRVDRHGSAIYVMNADGTDLTRLTSGRALLGQVAWSPDGGRIAFSRGGDIYGIKANGSDETKLTAGPALEDLVSKDAPAFSPDGERVAFLGTRDGAQRRVIWTMDADGGAPSPLPDSPDTGLSFSPPAFSPDAERIAFVSHVPPGASAPGIYVADTDGGTPKRLRGTRHGDQDPSWSPAAENQ